MVDPLGSSIGPKSSLECIQGIAPSVGGKGILLSLEETIGLGLSVTSWKCAAVARTKCMSIGIDPHV